MSGLNSIHEICLLLIKAKTSLKLLAATASASLTQTPDHTSTETSKCTEIGLIAILGLPLFYGVFNPIKFHLPHRLVQESSCQVCIPRETECR